MGVYLFVLSWLCKVLLQHQCDSVIMFSSHGCWILGIFFISSEWVKLDISSFVRHLLVESTVICMIEYRHMGCVHNHVIIGGRSNWARRACMAIPLFGLCGPWLSLAGTWHCSDRQYSDRHCSDRHCSDKRYPWALYTVSQKNKTPISCP